VALRHAAAGFSILPVNVFQDQNGDWKKPPMIRDWRNRATTDARQVHEWWKEFPNAVAGIELGRSGLIVIDADRHEADADGVAALARLRPNHDGDFAHPIILTAGLGEHHYYRQPAGKLLGNGEGQLPHGINIRGSGGFVVASGSVRPDGAMWEQASDTPELCEAFRDNAIAELPGWLVEILSARLPRTDSPPLSLAAPSSSREQAYAQAAVKSCVAELETTARSSRNNKLNAIAYHLGGMVARGWMDQQDVTEHLVAASGRNGLVADDGADSVRDTIESGLRAGITHPQADLLTFAHKESAEPASPAPSIIPVIWDGEASPSRAAWLVKDLVPMATSGLIVGESRAGKTFVGVHLAEVLSKGSTFFGKRARQGGTLYVAAEAPGTIPGRLHAARLGRIKPFLDEGGKDKTTGKEPQPLCVATISSPPNLLTEQGRGQLVATALGVSEQMQAKFGFPLRLIIIDTMLAAFEIRDWNDPAETRRVMNALARLAEETGAVVLGVHHHGKDITRGAAGSYALTAAADFILSVFAESDLDGVVSSRRIAVTKLRDGPTGWSCEFDVTPFKIGVDEDDDEIISAFVEPKTVTAGFGRSNRRKKEKAPAQSSTAFTEAFEEAINEHGISRATPGTGTTVKAIRVPDVRASFVRHYRPDGQSGNLGDAKRQAFKRAMKAALGEGRLKQDSWDGDEWLWRENE
jgi:hypothetical protein